VLVFAKETLEKLWLTILAARRAQAEGYALQPSNMYKMREGRMAEVDRLPVVEVIAVAFPYLFHVLLTRRKPFR